MNEEILAKAKAAGSPEELIELAKANGKEMTAEQAAAIFNSLAQGGEISDEELENAVGGCAWNPTIDCDALRANCGWPGVMRESCTVSSLWSRWACKICGNAIEFSHLSLPGEEKPVSGCEHAMKMRKMNCSNCKWNNNGVCGDARWSH